MEPCVAGGCPLLPSLIPPSLPIPVRADRFVRQVGLGCVQGHTGRLAHGDSERALFEEGAQTGVSDRTKALVAAPVCAVEEVGNWVCRSGPTLLAWEVLEGFLVLPLGQ